MEYFIQGLIVCFGGIVSIGAQNAFLLKQGILKQHVFPLALIFFLGDVCLMTVGVLGLGELISRLPVLSLVIAILGVIFLFTYGSQSFLSMFRVSGILTQSTRETSSLKRTLMFAIAITFLNPYVYIDTVVILGAIGGKLVFEQKIAFLLGAFTCSFIWFFGVGYGAGFLAPYFAKRRVWQILDFITGIIMYVLAISLVIYAWNLMKQL